MVVLRMRLEALSTAAAADLGRVVRVARTLEPGEVLALRLGAEPDLAGVRARLGDDDLRALSCAFAPDDWEAFIWRSPPEAPPPEQALPASLDVRLLPPPLRLIVPVRALARLEPGEGLFHLSDRGPAQLLMDLLDGRAHRERTRVGSGGVEARLVRLAAGRAADGQHDPGARGTGEGRSSMSSRARTAPAGE